MQVIIIGAGRGARLMPTTADSPKCFAEVEDRRIIDWTVEAFRENGIENICFIGGYRIEKVRETFPDFDFRHNVNWEYNNILASLFYAEDLMDAPFISCYSDTLITPQAVESVLAANTDIALSIDTDWLPRYSNRNQHPSDDAEKVTVTDGLITRIHRSIEEQHAHGEFTGMVKFSAQGAVQLKEAYHRCMEASGDGPFREADCFEKAYLIHLFQDMLEAGAHMSPAETPGGYIEIDTQEDLDYARKHWRTKHLGK
ncbi:MAG TPA: phosphocholine cytidylyltransferase family protein [Candidatus Hydrogenedentes bacterium]|jgi:choline kinase|nr:phosphocholine cytidylyltransferase family protein [Candidatus Hydrogenedentota bacterium]